MKCNEIKLKPNNKHWKIIDEKELDYVKERTLFFEWHERKGKDRKNWNLAFLNWLKKANAKRHSQTDTLRAIIKEMKEKEEA